VKSDNYVGTFSKSVYDPENATGCRFSTEADLEFQSLIFSYVIPYAGLFSTTSILSSSVPTRSLSEVSSLNSDKFWGVLIKSL